VIDTTETEAAALREIIASRFAKEGRNLSVVLTSFSFKRGVPRESDMVFDVRFLQNPYYDPGLKQLTGLDAKVGEYIEADSDFDGFFTHVTTLLKPLLPRYLAEGKQYLTISVGCTGGLHRSVYVVQKLGEFLQNLGYNVTIRHRDLEQK
jgi:RNase adapter protein RapZ